MITVKVLNEIRDGTRVIKETWLDKFEKRIGWDAETRKIKKEEKESGFIYLKDMWNMWKL